MFLLLLVTDEVLFGEKAVTDVLRIIDNYSIPAILLESCENFVIYPKTHIQRNL